MSSIKEVAKMANVSIATVSHVINGTRFVADDTKARVKQAMTALKYYPNSVAQSLRSKKSKLVALIVPNIWNPFFSELTYYIEDELNSEQYKLLLCNSERKPEKEIYYLDMLRQDKVAGILGITYNEIDDSLSDEIPMISIDRHFSKKITCVTSDNFEGGRMALRELVKAGAKKPAFIGNVTAVFSETMKRRAGFVHEAELMGIDYVVYEQPDPIRDYETYYKDFFELHSNVDGVFAITDMLAAQYIERAGKLGIHVPKDVKVIGYDGIQDHHYFHPVLSTIRQPVEEMARTAVRLLFRKIEGHTLEQETYQLPVIFRQGETT